MLSQGIPGTLRALPRNSPSFSFDTLSEGGAAPHLHARPTCVPEGGSCVLQPHLQRPVGPNRTGKAGRSTPAPQTPGRTRRTEAAWAPQRCRCERTASGRPLSGTSVCARTGPSPGMLVPRAPLQQESAGAQGAWAVGRPLPSAGYPDPQCPRHPEEAGTGPLRQSLCPTWWFRILLPPRTRSTSSPSPGRQR